MTGKRVAKSGVAGAARMGGAISGPEVTRIIPFASFGDTPASD
jgi:hypothetical protein